MRTAGTDNMMPDDAATGADVVAQYVDANAK
jgi:hypothetical protein